MITKTEVDHLAFLLKQKADFELANRTLSEMTNAGSATNCKIVIEGSGNSISMQHLDIDQRRLLANAMLAHHNKMLEEVTNTLDQYIISKKV